MTEQEKRMEAAGWRKCYWLGYGNLQTEYDYEPSEELVADMEESGEQPFKLDEETISFFIEDGRHDAGYIEYFIANPDDFAFSWLEVTMRITPLENDFIQRAAKAIAKGFIEYLNSYRAKEMDADVRNGLIKDLKEIAE